MEPTEVETVRRGLHMREPLFHREPAGAGRAHFAKMVVPDLWEVGASANRYELETVLNTLEERQREAGDDCWRVDGFEVRILAPRVWLATYVLQQDRGALVAPPSGAGTTNVG